MTDFPLSGPIAPRFAPVQDIVAENFAAREEHGMQFCVMQHGEVLLDICAGWQDRKKETPVAEDTLFSVYSSGKAMAALVIAWLADQDRLGYNQLVKTIWPEMDIFGKGELSVAQFMSHQSGLSGISDPDWTVEDWYDWEKTCQALCDQEPLFEPGSASGYHPVTYGFLAGEIARRADAEGRHLGTILREELAAPVGADVWIGLPEDEHARCSTMIKPKRMADLGEVNDATRAAFMMKASSPGGKSITEWRKAQLAGSNCHATARGLASLMQIAINGRAGGQVMLAEDTVAALGKSRTSGPNLVLPFDLDFAAGIMRNTPNFFYGPNASTLGHSGWGGSCIFADPVTGLHGAYVMNRQDNSLLGDPRPVSLINAVYDCL